MKKIKFTAIGLLLVFGSLTGGTTFANRNADGSSSVAGQQNNRRNRNNRNRNANNSDSNVNPSPIPR